MEVTVGINAGALKKDRLVFGPHDGELGVSVAGQNGVSEGQGGEGVAGCPLGGGGVVIDDVERRADAAVGDGVEVVNSRRVGIDAGAEGDAEGVEEAGLGTEVDIGPGGGGALHPGEGAVAGELGLARDFKIDEDVEGGAVVEGDEGEDVGFGGDADGGGDGD